MGITGRAAPCLSLTGSYFKTTHAHKHTKLTQLRRASFCTGQPATRPTMPKPIPPQTLTFLRFSESKRGPPSTRPTDHCCCLDDRATQPLQQPTAQRGTSIYNGKGRKASYLFGTRRVLRRHARKQPRFPLRHQSNEHNESKALCLC